MPDRDIEVDATSVVVEWGPLRFTGPGTLRLTSDGVVLEATGSGTLRASYPELKGGGWRMGFLTIHGDHGNAVIESAQGLELAWVQLLERACPLPELARDHRLLGSRRGGSVTAQARFLAPLLEARKRLERDPDLESRIATLDARQLRDRMTAALQAIARDAFPGSDPDRRALEAELEDAMAPFYAGLNTMDAAATHFRGAPEAIRFLAWREWVDRVLSAFAQADSAWASASRSIPAPDRP